MSGIAEKLFTFLKNEFGNPRFCHWGYPIWIMSVMLAMIYTGECLAVKWGAPVPTTSLVGFSVLMILNVFFCLILPAFGLCKGFEEKIIGEYSGAGVLVTAFASGFPLMLISSSLHNICAWLWLRMDLKIIFPAFFYTGGTASSQGFILSLITETILPAFGISVFFYGLLWSRFRSREKLMGIIVIAVFYTFYSLNVLNSSAILVCGLWFGLLRYRSGNIFAPFLCILGMKTAELTLTSVLTKVDITTIQTYSDIPQTYLYASVPALFLGGVLLYFIKVLMDNFGYSYFSDLHGVDSDKMSEEDMAIPAFVRGLCPALFAGTLILVALNILVLKGAHI